MLRALPEIVLIVLISLLVIFIIFCLIEQLRDKDHWVVIFGKYKSKPVIYRSFILSQ